MVGEEDLECPHRDNGSDANDVIEMNAVVVANGK